jgi:hypothetical protein
VLGLICVTEWPMLRREGGVPDGAEMKAERETEGGDLAEVSCCGKRRAHAASIGLGTLAQARKSKGMQNWPIGTPSPKPDAAP